MFGANGTRERQAEAKLRRPRLIGPGGVHDVVVTRPMLGRALDALTPVVVEHQARQREDVLRLAPGLLGIEGR